MSKAYKPSHQLTFDEAVEIWLMWWDGEYKNRIAAKFDVNVWRLYEVRDGKMHPGSREVAASIRAARGLGGIPTSSLGPLFDAVQSAG